MAVRTWREARVVRDHDGPLSRPRKQGLPCVATDCLLDERGKDDPSARVRRSLET